jgi:hypothetical protein
MSSVVSSVPESHSYNYIMPLRLLWLGHSGRAYPKVTF